MALPLGQANLVGHQVLALTDLALTNPLTVGTLASSAIQTAVPSTVIVLIKLASGTGATTFKLASSATSTVTYGSPLDSIAIDSSADTSQHFLIGNTDSSHLFFGVQAVTTTASTVPTDLTVLVLDKFTNTQDFVSLHAGVNAVASTVNGTGSGTFVITPA